MNSFNDKLQSHNLSLTKLKIEVLQVNLGRLCNLTCSHCHVEAGPAQTRENMDRNTAEAVVSFLVRSTIRTLDLTGGAPEMNPNFRFLVSAARGMGIHVMDRCNLTILLEAGQEALAEFLAKHRVEVVASLPCYSKENVDKQRGRGTFEGSILALKRLNDLGYGQPGSGLDLNLVYNPVGAHLPPSQVTLEADYKERLSNDFGILFNRLYTITNMPITRYEKYLKATDQYEAYVKLLQRSFNSATVDGLMCQNTLSVGWDGKVYDCDFNQMLGMAAGDGPSGTIFDLEPDDLKMQPVRTGNHCFACTAGAGSSCQGAVTV